MAAADGQTAATATAALAPDKEAQALDVTLDHPEVPAEAPHSVATGNALLAAGAPASVAAQTGALPAEATEGGALASEEAYGRPDVGGVGDAPAPSPNAEEEGLLDKLAHVVRQDLVAEATEQQPRTEEEVMDVDPAAAAEFLAPDGMTGMEVDDREGIPEGQSQLSSPAVGSAQPSKLNPHADSPIISAVTRVDDPVACVDLTGTPLPSPNASVQQPCGAGVIPVKEGFLPSPSAAADSVADWVKHRQKWFNTDVDPKQQQDNKRRILLYMRETLMQQFQDLEGLINSYRVAVRMCPISGRSAELEKLVQSRIQELKSVGPAGQVDLSISSISMDQLVTMFKAAQNEQDGAWLLALLEGDKKDTAKALLGSFVDKDGLTAVARWVCDNKSLEEGAKINHPGVLQDSMLPRLMGILRHIDWGKRKNAASELSSSKIIVKLNKRCSATEYKSEFKALKQRVKEQIANQIKPAERKDKQEDRTREKKEDDKAKNKVATNAPTGKEKTSIFGNMFGSKDKKKVATGPNLSSSRPAELIDDDERNPASTMGGLGSSRAVDQQGPLGKRSNVSIQESRAGEERASKAPKPLPKLGSKNSPVKEKRKRLSWGDGLNDGKGKQIKDLCSDAFEIGEDQQGYPIYEGKLTKVKIFERYDVKGTGNDSLALADGDVTGLTFAEKNRIEKANENKTGVKHVLEKNRIEKAKENNSRDLGAEDRKKQEDEKWLATKRSAQSYKAEIPWPESGPVNLLPVLVVTDGHGNTTDCRPCRFREDFTPTASHQEEMDRQRHYSAITYRDLAQVPPNPQLIADELRLPDEKNRRITKVVGSGWLEFETWDKDPVMTPAPIPAASQSGVPPYHTSGPSLQNHSEHNMPTSRNNGHYSHTTVSYHHQHAGANNLQQSAPSVYQPQGTGYAGYDRGPRSGHEYGGSSWPSSSYPDAYWHDNGPVRDSNGWHGPPRSQQRWIAEDQREAPAWQQREHDNRGGYPKSPRDRHDSARGGGGRW